MDKKEYDTLMRNLETNDYYRNLNLDNRVNCYICPECGHITKTKDIDRGTTPFMHECEKCDSLAYSSFYEDISPNCKPTQEWYRPGYQEFRYLPEQLKEHVLVGGLISRKIWDGA